MYMLLIEKDCQTCDISVHAANKERLRTIEDQKKIPFVQQNSWISKSLLM